jgi:RNA ligase (TIGR02306 family)
MSDFKILVTNIEEVKPHPKESVLFLEIVKVFGWEVVTRKGKFKVGDKVIYIPVDSVLPEPLESKLFPEDSKIKLSKSRVKAIRIQGFVSQGMVVTPDEVNLNETICSIGKDLREILNISKFEPPENPNMVASFKDKKGKTVKVKIVNNALFKEYGGLNHLKYNPNVFEEFQEVVVTEKIHGSNSRCGWLENKPKNLWQKIKKFFKCFDSHQFCYGSNRVQLQSKKYSGYYSNDIYSKIVEKYHLKVIMPKDYIMFYEIYGPSVQKNYHYGLSNADVDMVVFDVMRVTSDSAEWLSHDEMINFVETINHELTHIDDSLQIKTAPVLYRGPYNNIDNIRHLTKGDSVFCPKQKIREGVVVRNVGKEVTVYSREKDSMAMKGIILKSPTLSLQERKAYKIISDEYLMKDNTDFH